MKNKCLLLALMTASYAANAQVTKSEEILDEIIIEENRMQIPFQQSTRNIQVITKEEIKNCRFHRLTRF